MKRVIKNNIFGFIVGLSLGLIGIVSAAVINARDVIYRDTNVESAINDIYTNTNSTISALQAELASRDTLTLKSRVTISGQSPTSGTMYITEDLKSRYQYFKLNVEGTPVNMGNYKFRGAHKTNGNGDLIADTQYSTSDYSRVWFSLTPNSSASSSSAADATYILYLYN